VIERTPSDLAQIYTGSGSSQFDRKPAFWTYGSVKTTLDLPDDLMRAVKMRAVHDHKKLRGGPITTAKLRRRLTGAAINRGPDRY
jgi:hypothetical protein